jgi:flagellar export protein FliJ
MKFRFETLLQVRKNKENLLQKELGDILAHKQTQQNRQEFMQNTRNSNLKQINHRMTQDLNVDTYVLYNNFFNGNHLQKERQQKIISEVDVRADAKRQELVEVRRKRRTMEILKERDLRTHKKKLAKIETEMMNEIASNYWRLSS